MSIYAAINCKPLMPTRIFCTPHHQIVKSPSPVSFYAYKTKSPTKAGLFVFVFEWQVMSMERFPVRHTMYPPC